MLHLLKPFYISHKIAATLALNFEDLDVIFRIAF